MGVTPTNGALTPAYNPLARPSFATLLVTTSMAPLYTPASAVCSLTLTRSKGWPTMTAQMPPKPPAARERRPANDFAAAISTSAFSSALVSGTCGTWMGRASRALLISVAGLEEGIVMGWGVGGGWRGGRVDGEEDGGDAAAAAAGDGDDDDVRRERRTEKVEKEEMGKEAQDQNARSQINFTK